MKQTSKPKLNMPTLATYPGVYIEEVPSGVRTITGVATSITAFFGRARRGPVNKPVLINNLADFERGFGGLWIESPMSYAVRDFYQNGGARQSSCDYSIPPQRPNRVTFEALNLGGRQIRRIMGAGVGDQRERPVRDRRRYCRTFSGRGDQSSILQ